MIVEEAKQLHYGQTIYSSSALNSDGTPRRWRVMGKVKTWKTQPERVEISLKFGLYIWMTITEKDLNLFHLTDEEAFRLYKKGGNIK